MTPMQSQRLFSIRCAALLALLLAASNVWANMYVSPGLSTDGNYTVVWDATLGCYIYDDNSFYCLWLEEDGAYVSMSGNFLEVSGKPPGTYTYSVRYVFYYYGSPVYDYVIEGPAYANVFY
jgi:hypothetical protein